MPGTRYWIIFPVLTRCLNGRNWLPRISLDLRTFTPPKTKKTSSQARFAFEIVIELKVSKRQDFLKIPHPSYMNIEPASDVINTCTINGLPSKLSLTVTLITIRDRTDCQACLKTWLLYGTVAFEINLKLICHIWELFFRTVRENGRAWRKILFFTKSIKIYEQFLCQFFCDNSYLIVQMTRIGQNYYVINIFAEKLVCWLLCDK